jgi:hypothetical protein
MSRVLRPRFEIRTEEAAEVLLERIDHRLRSRNCPFIGYVVEGRAVIHVPRTRQRLWSAELRVAIGRQGEATVVEGLYAPHPHVWVTYVILLAAVVVGITAAVVFTLVELSLDQRPAALFALPPLLLVGAAAYAMAFIGQGLATDEMDELRTFLDEALCAGPGLPSHIRNLRPGEDDSVSRQAG